MPADPALSNILLSDVAYSLQRVFRPVHLPFATAIFTGISKQWQIASYYPGQKWETNLRN